MQYVAGSATAHLDNIPKQNSSPMRGGVGKRMRDCAHQTTEKEEASDDDGNKEDTTARNRVEPITGKKVEVESDQEEAHDTQAPQ